MTTAYAEFSAAQIEAQDHLESALHNVSFTAHLMEMNGGDDEIRMHESALDRAAAARAEIGRIHDEEMALRSQHAGLAA